MASSKKYWFYLLLAVPLYLTWTFDHSLWNPDETRDAGIAAEMWRTKNGIVPTLNGVPFLEKPPLYYWTCAAVYKLTGRVTAGTTRLPSALYGLLGILFTFLIGNRLKGPRYGLFAAGIVATAMQYFRMSHTATMDICLAALITGALYFYIRGSTAGFAVMTILAFYAKGFLGIVLPGVVVTIDLFSQKKFKDWLLLVSICAVFFVALVSPWIYGLWKSGGTNALKIFFIDNHWKRFSSANADHTNSPWYIYLLSLPGDFLPWSFLLIPMVWHIAHQWKIKSVHSQFRFVSLWLISILGLLTFSSSKRSIYLLPIFPAAALLSAGLWDNIANSGLKQPLEKWGFWISSVLGYAIAAAGCVAFFAIGKNYLWGFAAVTLTVASLMFFIQSIKSKRFETSILLVLLTVATTVASASLSCMKQMDRDKTFKPVIWACQSLAGESGVVVGYDWSEMERGVFSFYFGKTLTNFENPDQLITALQEPHRLILVANRNKKSVLEPLLNGKMKLEYEYRPNQKTRSYLIYSSVD